MSEIWVVFDEGDHPVSVSITHQLAWQLAFADEARGDSSITIMAKWIDEVLIEGWACKRVQVVEEEEKEEK